MGEDFRECDPGLVDLLEIYDDYLEKSVYVKANLIVILVALCVAILQGNYATSIASGANGQLQLVLLLLIGFVSLFLKL